MAFVVVYVFSPCIYIQIYHSVGIWDVRFDVHNSRLRNGKYDPRMWLVWIQTQMSECSSFVVTKLSPVSFGSFHLHLSLSVLPLPSNLPSFICCWSMTHAYLSFACCYRNRLPVLKLSYACVPQRHAPHCCRYVTISVMESPCFICNGISRLNMT